MKKQTLSRIPQEAAAMAAGVLLPYWPGITGRDLQEALQLHADQHAEQAPRELPAGELLTVSEVAARLKVTPRHVFNMLRSGKLPRRKVGPRATRIPAEALKHFAEFGEG